MKKKFDWLKLAWFRIFGANVKNPAHVTIRVRLDQREWMHNTCKVDDYRTNTALLDDMIAAYMTHTHPEVPVRSSRIKVWIGGENVE